MVLQNVSEELETANKYSSRHGAASKLRDPAKNGGRDGGFFAPSPVHHGDHHGGRHAAVEKLGEGGEGEVEFVSYVSRTIYTHTCHCIPVLITGICGKLQVYIISPFRENVNIREDCHFAPLN